MASCQAQPHSSPSSSPAPGQVSTTRRRCSSSKCSPTTSRSSKGYQKASTDPSGSVADWVHLMSHLADPLGLGDNSEPRWSDDETYSDVVIVGCEYTRTRPGQVNPPPQTMAGVPPRTCQDLSAAAPDVAHADLENVLLYNLGSGCYSHLAHQGIVCRRRPGTDHLHHVRYASVEPTEVTMTAGLTLATAQLDALPSGNTPSHWWAALRGRLRTTGDTPYAGEFGVRAELGSAWRRTLAPSVKPMLDGLVAALHVHDGSERDRATAALCEVGAGDARWELLNDPAGVALGRRRLVRSHRSKHRLESRRRTMRILRSPTRLGQGRPHGRDHRVVTPRHGDGDARSDCGNAIARRQTAACRRPQEAPTPNAASAGGLTRKDGSRACRVILANERRATPMHAVQDP